MTDNYLDNFESILEDGLVKLCEGACILSGKVTSTKDGKRTVLRSQDIDDRWEAYVKDYIADAVENFNDFPDSALAWPAFLGMAVANGWDRDWSRHASDSYTSHYGSRGWDDMDEHILFDVLHLKKNYAQKLEDTLAGCSEAILALIRHEGIEAQTSLGFYCLARAYTVMYRIGAAIELERLGYSKAFVRLTDPLC